jgi:hypothetical protein
MKKSQKQQTTTTIGGNHELEKTNPNTQVYPSVIPHKLHAILTTVHAQSPPFSSFPFPPYWRKEKVQPLWSPHLCIYVSTYQGSSSSTTLCTEVVIVVLHPSPYVPRSSLSFFIHHPMYRGCCCCCSSSTTLCTKVVVVLHPPPYVPRLLLLFFI